jgi:hypothetical protein
MLVSVNNSTWHHILEDCSVNINLTEHKLIYIPLLSLILLCVKLFVESVNVRFVGHLIVHCVWLCSEILGFEDTELCWNHNSATLAPEL